MARRVILCFSSAIWFLLVSASPSAAEFGKEFWGRWGDGKAEMAAYDLSFFRYGESRRGSAVAIFVTEPFRKSDRVKSDQDRGTGIIPVMKLNLTRDFPTGIYDYNLMTSVFVGLEPFAGMPPGRTAKVSFSSQEWCGHVYHQALFHARSVDESWNSYFEGEADGRRRVRAPFDGHAEDALLLWARGLAEPFLGPEERRESSVFTSLLYARLNHTPATWERAVYEVDAEPIFWNGPAGRRLAQIRRVTVGGKRLWTFWVETSGDRRVLEWTVENLERSPPVSLERGRLLKSDRLAYWSLQTGADRRHLGRIGLSPRHYRSH